MQADLIIKNIRQLVTCRRSKPGPVTGGDLNHLEIIENGAVASFDGKIVAVGTTSDVERRIELAYSGEVIDATDQVVTPGLVDAHTHPVFAATREDEFEMRNLGKSYMEIAEAGGGIRNSVRKLREAPAEKLFDNAIRYLDLMLQHGTTTIEAKSGYGLSTESEIKQLEVIRKLAENHAVDIVPTFLGAHEIPDEYREDREGYIRLLIDEMIPEVVKGKLAVFSDIFCEKNVFEIEDSERIQTAARDHGLKLKFHADEIVGIGGAELAARLGAVSADHLDVISDNGIAEMAKSGTIGVLLPGTVHFLDLKARPPARKMIEAGVPISLATDFNPGSSATPSLQIIMNFGAAMLKMTAAEIINCVTINSACALLMDDMVGSIEVGKQADFVVWSADNYRQLPYFYGINLADQVIKKGKPVS
ncbi:MAG: imidazolonepropionase [candidate division Zixibacteria bacterium]|nr:imidazolonepropionase [candidate division Zixibacteria bacterium]MBU1470207.1 imidazolonepropionase [candidate division Zixibacteria bacterium]MBU2625204.1 imidazolonepropionase [candidate division Zixibacteria bacterium]